MQFWVDTKIGEMEVKLINVQGYSFSAWVPQVKMLSSADSSKVKF